MFSERIVYRILLYTESKFKSLLIFLSIIIAVLMQTLFLLLQFLVSHSFESSIITEMFNPDEKL